jgi:hypothetical protein
VQTSQPRWALQDSPAHRYGFSEPCYIPDMEISGNISVVPPPLAWQPFLQTYCKGKHHWQAYADPGSPDKLLRPQMVGASSSSLSGASKSRVSPSCLGGLSYTYYPTLGFTAASRWTTGATTWKWNDMAWMLSPSVIVQSPEITRYRVVGLDLTRTSQNKVRCYYSSVGQCASARTSK